MSGIELTGLDKLTRALKAAGDEAPEALAAAMHDEMEEIVEDAKRRAPVDTGTLRASGVVLRPDRSSGQIVVEGGFGGAASDYAVVQHEDTTLSHTVGEAKFLEKPMLERAPKLGGRLGIRIHAALLRRLG